MAKTYKPKRFTDIGLLKRLDFTIYHFTTRRA